MLKKGIGPQGLGAYKGLNTYTRECDCEKNLPGCDCSESPAKWVQAAAAIAPVVIDAIKSKQEDKQQQ